MHKIILRYGLYSGALAAVLMILNALYLTTVTTFDNAAITGYIGILLSLIFVFIGVRVYRDEACGGHITFLSALKAAALIALINCICYAILWMIVSDWLMPDFLDKYGQYYVDKMRAEKAPEAEIQKMVADMADFKVMYANPFYKFALTLMEPLPVAVVVTFLSALILKKK
jgi:Protein of unknown function (DUF4199)